MARIQEIEQRVATLRAEAIAAEQQGGPPAEPALYVRLGAGVAAYGTARERAFTEGIALLTPPSDGTAEDQQERWAEHFGEWGNEGCDQLLDLVERDTDPVQFAFELIAAQESASVAAIVAMPVARASGELREHLRTLATQTTALQDEWRTLAGLDERANAEIAKLRLEVLDMCKRCVSDIRGVGPKIEDVVGTAIDLWKRKEDCDPEPSLADPIKAIVESLDMTRRTLDEATQDSLKLYADKQRVFGMFEAVRARVGDWLEQVDPETVTRMFSDASRAALDAATKCVTDGQRRDCEELAQRAIKAVEPLLAEFLSAWDRFYREFEGRFTGDVSDETVELLSEQELFGQFWRDVESLDVVDEIRELDNGLTTLTKTSLDGLTDEQRAEFETHVRARLLSVQDKIRAADASLWERFRTQFVDVPVRSFVDRLKSLRGYRR